MTKSQNTKKEQHCIKQNEKSFIQKDLSLTELWQKGELPSGWYYVRLIRGESRIDLYINEKNEWIDCPDNIIDTVVCEVPSYEEYLESESHCAVYSEVNKSLKEQNAQLKELLKWCAKIMREPTVYIGTLEEKERYINNLHKKQQLLHKIDEVLK